MLSLKIYLTFKKKLSMKNNKVISYLTIRKSIGILGISLPFLLIIVTSIYRGEFFIASSISKFYYTASRNVLVGVFSAVAIFMFAYRGYDKKDRIAGKIAFFAAIGAAYFPTTTINYLQACETNVQIFTLRVVIHYISAITFFLVLIYFSLFLFTRTTNNDKNNYTKQKKQRNLVYKFCGYIILGSLILLIIYTIFKCQLPILHKYHIIFWLESIALFAFGTSWLVKGKFILDDK